MNKQLYNFLSGNAPNYNHLCINDIWNFSNEELEQNHKYIQWLFPLKERSKYNFFAPKIKHIEEYNNDLIKNNILKSFDRMLIFYGLEYKNDKIIKNKEFELRKCVWVSNNNHNYFRITRIIKCLELFGFDKQATDFVNCLYEIYSDNLELISYQTFVYWKSSLKYS